MFKIICALLLLSFSVNLCLSDDDPPEVETPLGNLKGYWRTSEDGRPFAAFEGVPYAKPPVGDLRFEEAQPITPWLGTWEASRPVTCPQVSILEAGLDLQGQEDCLYMNIYVPDEYLGATKNKLDVIVIIHGGAFMMGSGSMMVHPEFLMDNDIILVSFNYRLGFLGFLSTENDVIPGNNGLKDQILALKWVKDNIASFGGNPDSVTITGLSAGGASVHFHYLSPLSKGLFKRGLSQSGTALDPWSIKENPLESAKKLAVLVGCPDQSTEDLKKCLKQRPLDNLIKQTAYFQGYGTMPFSPFAPVVEKGSSRPFLDKDPYLLLKEGKVLDAPWITSHTAEDGLFPAASYFPQLEEVNEFWMDLFPLLTDTNSTLPLSRRETAGKEILDFYLGPGEEINEKTFDNFAKIFTDRLYAIGGELAAKLQAKATKSPVYYYIFSYRDGENKAVRFISQSPDVEGVSHADDGIYFYGLVTVTPLSEQDKRLKDVCQNILISYASTGVPSLGEQVTWEATGYSELTYLNISGPEDLKIQKVPNLAPSDFWIDLGILEYENLENVKDEL